MATGALDANGIWIYGEDDSEPTFSELLNKLGESTSDVVGSLDSEITVLQELPKAGLVPVNTGTATVTGGGSSASENALGTITFTSAASILLDDVFTAPYRNFKIVMDFDCTANTTITSQFRNNGSNLTAAAYNWGHIGLSGGASNTGNGVAVTSVQLAPATLSASTNILEIEVIDPTSVGTRTQYIGRFSRSRDTYITGGSYQAAETDGMSLVLGTGNMTGKLTVYGWNQ